MPLPTETDELPLFGHDVFAAALLAPAPPGGVPPPPTYVLGPGDSVELHVWGRGIDYLLTTQTVATDGGLYAEPAGRLVLAGKSLADAEAAALAIFRKYYPECSVSVTVARLRTLEVLVIGDVVRPGRQVLPGTATVFTALYAAGGPSESGSLRAIDVRRGGELLSSLDLYDYLLRGEAKGDLPLQAGDTVFVHVIGDVVVVMGEVRRPARYEIGQGATLAEALDMAGGLRGSGYAQRIRLVRSEQNRERVVLEANLVAEREKWASVALADGDEVEVLPILEELRNAVTIEGQVRRPGTYQLLAGMTVSDLIRQAEDLTPQASREVGYVLRESPEGLRQMIRVELGAALAGDAAADVALQPRDIVRVDAIDEMEPAKVYAEGAVTRSGEYEFSRDMRLSDLLRAAGGVTSDAYGEAITVVRKTPDMEDQYLTLSLGRVMAGGEDDVLLQPRDRLVVDARDEKGREKLVQVQGAVGSAGEYPLGAGMRVSDALRMAGGLLPEAGARGRVIRGQSAGTPAIEEIDLAPVRSGDPPSPDPVLREGDVVAVQGVGGFQVAAEVVQVQGHVSQPGVYPLRLDGGDKPMRLSDLVTAGGGLLPGAFPEMAAVYHTEKSMLPWDERIASVRAVLSESGTGQPIEEEGEEGSEADATVPPRSATTAIPSQPGATPTPATTTAASAPTTGAAPTGATPSAPASAAAPAQPPQPASRGAGAAAQPASGTRYAPAGRAAQGMITTPSGAVIQVIGSSLKGEAFLITAPRPLDHMPISSGMPVDLALALAQPGGKADIALTPGDVLMVWEQPSTVVVDGAVAAPGKQPYVAGATVRQYLAQAGDLTRDHDFKHAVVIRYNGRAMRADRDQRVEPGDWILVPTRHSTQIVRDRHVFPQTVEDLVTFVSRFVAFRLNR